MFLQNDDYYDQNSSRAEFDFENFVGTIDTGRNDFDSVDFSIYPSPEQIDFGASQPSAGNPNQFDVAGNILGTAVSNIDPALRNPDAQPGMADQMALGAAQFGISLDSPNFFDAADGIQTVLGSNTSSSLPGSSTLDIASPKLASQPVGNMLNASYGQPDQHALPTWRSRPSTSISGHSAYSMPPPGVPAMITRQSRHRNPQSPTREQKSRLTSYQLNSRRPEIPETFVPYIDVANPPRRESEVHDTRGCRDTTLATEYYYRINAPTPLTNFFGKGSNIKYQGPEFHAAVQFTGPEFMRYLRTCPREPTLIIQMQPQKCNHRYIRGGQSFKCRNKNCPDPRKTIWKGHFRVCITEFYDKAGDWVNPFQSAAGYLHLYCLETMLNLGEIVADMPITVLPEARNFQHEPHNPMELSRLEQRTFQNWVDEFTPQWASFRDQCTRSGIPRNQWPAFGVADEDRLYRRLTAAHLEKNVGTRKMAEKRRAQAGGKKITGHVDQLMGDVGKHVAVMKRRRDAVAVATLANLNNEVLTEQQWAAPSRKRRRLSFQVPTEEQKQQQRQNSPTESVRSSGKRHHLPNSRYNLRSASPKQNHLISIPSQPQIQLLPVSSTLLPQQFEVGQVISPDFTKAAFDDAEFNAFLGAMNTDISFPLAPLSEEVETMPGDSIVEQSIVINTEEAVPVPVLAPLPPPPPRPRQISRHNTSDPSLSKSRRRSQRLSLSQSSPLAVVKHNAAGVQKRRSPRTPLSQQKSPLSAVQNASVQKQYRRASTAPAPRSSTKFSQRPSSAVSTESDSLDAFLESVNAIVE